jgi:hypothetical protein
MRRTHTATALVLTAVALLPVWPRAQDVPNRRQPVRLAYRFMPGSAQRYVDRVSAVVVTEAPASFGPGELTARINATYEYLERMTGVAGGVGTVLVRLDGVDARLRMGGVEVRETARRGQVTMRAPGYVERSRDREMVQAVLAEPFHLRRAATGTALDFGSSPTYASLIPLTLGGGLGTYLALPSEPVPVGGRWNSASRDRPGGLKGNEGLGALVDLELTHTLRGLERRNGVLTALIDTTGRAATPGPGHPLRDLTETIRGTTRFDVDHGRVISGRVRTEIAFSTQDLAEAGRAGSPKDAGTRTVARLRAAVVHRWQELTPARPPRQKKGPRT